MAAAVGADYDQLLARRATHATEPATNSKEQIS